MNSSEYKEKKSVLLIASEDLVIRNTLETSVWEQIRQSFNGVHITLIVPKGRAKELGERYGAEGIEVREFCRTKPNRFDALVSTLLYAGLPTHTNHWSKMRAYLRGDASLVATYAKRLHAAVLGRVHAYQWLLRWLFQIVGKDVQAQTLFDAVQPDVVISLSITNFEVDVVLMREAKRRGIRVVGMTRSWDNLTSHGALRVVPSRIIVQNEFLHDAVRGVQGISKHMASVDVVGLPHYDVARDVETYAGTREAFCAEYGLDPRKKILIYGAMGTFLFKRENDLLFQFSLFAQKCSVGEDIQFLYRPHPKFTLTQDSKSVPGVIIDRSATYRTEVNSERSASQELFRSLYHADVVITGASTFAIDAALLNKPIICINFDGSASSGDVRYWESVNRFYDSYTHFEELVAQGGVRVVNSLEALSVELRAYLVDPERDTEGRARIIRRFVGVTDGQAHHRLGAILAHEIERDSISL